MEYLECGIKCCIIIQNIFEEQKAVFLYWAVENVWSFLVKNLVEYCICYCSIGSCKQIMWGRERERERFHIDKLRVIYTLPRANDYIPQLGCIKRWLFFKSRTWLQILSVTSQLDLVSRSCERERESRFHIVKLRVVLFKASLKSKRLNSSFELLW